MIFQEQQLDGFFMDEPLLAGRVFNSCGVVSSAGSLKNSRLGKKIDQNDFVIR